MGNHTPHLLFAGLSPSISGFSTRIRVFFLRLGSIPSTQEEFCPKTLFAAVGTGAAKTVILPPAVAAEEEGPFGFPFLASAHRLCSAISLVGAGDTRTAVVSFAACS